MNKKAVVAASLKHLFKPDGTFFISSIEECAKILGVAIPAETYSELRALHCIKWADMPKELREEVFQTCLELFHNTTPEFDHRIIDAVIIGDKTSLDNFMAGDTTQRPGYWRRFLPWTKT